MRFPRHAPGHLSLGSANGSLRGPGVVVLCATPRDASCRPFGHRMNSTRSVAPIAACHDPNSWPGPQPPHMQNREFQYGTTDLSRQRRQGQTARHRQRVSAVHRQSQAGAGFLQCELAGPVRNNRSDACRSADRPHWREETPSHRRCLMPAEFGLPPARIGSVGSDLPPPGRCLPTREVGSATWRSAPSSRAGPWRLAPEAF
jgi:hypothetical protein